MSQSFIRPLSAMALAAATMLSVSAHAQGRPDLVAASLNAGARHVPGEVLVQFRPGVLAELKHAALARLGAEAVEELLQAARRTDGKGDLLRVKLPQGITVRAAIARLHAEGAVDFAEANWVYTTQKVFKDKYYADGSLWGMYGDASPLHTNQYGSQAGEAWNQGKLCSTGTYIGVIDEGAMFKHEDLKKNFWTNPFDPVDGIDNDGNGLIDDVHGWDFVSNDNTTFDGTGDDHGTHVSGTIGASGGKQQGVVGVCPNVTIINAKFLGASGGSTANAIKAVDYMTDLKTRHGLNLVATSNSWGGGGFSQALQDAIGRAGAAEILFVAAAGNGNGAGVGQNNDTTPHYPSSYPNANIIAVASITSTGAKSGFSNYGATTVDIGAPGEGIWSTVPKSGNVSGYASYSGTSMATPHVSGAVAMYATNHPGSTAAQIKAAILAAAIPTPSLAGKCVTGGRLDVSGL